ncbi:MAG TPA: ester cyclase [Pyrinomonadaceae bacterium]|nr:ester cyclase [Pyrinomonadaceae bacterium]
MYKDAEDNATIIRRWFEEVWNKGREDTIDELFSEEGVAHGLAGVADGKLRGPAGFKPFFRNFREAFPEMEVVVEDTVSEGDRVAARCTVRGRHEGDSLGFAATKRPVEFTGIAIVRIADGKIVEAWNNFDFMSMFQQLGALRTDAAPAGPEENAALPSLD